MHRVTSFSLCLYYFLPSVMMMTRLHRFQVIRVMLVLHHMDTLSAFLRYPLLTSGWTMLKVSGILQVSSQEFMQYPVVLMWQMRAEHVFRKHDLAEDLLHILYIKEPDFLSFGVLVFLRCIEPV